MGCQIETAKELLRDRLRDRGKLSGCFSYVQRMMGIRYSTAVDLLNTLEKQGFVTPRNAAGVRKPGPAWSAVTPWDGGGA